MPKSLLVNPQVVRREGSVELGSIPINPPRSTLNDIRHTVGDEPLLLMLRDMMVIREFESMLDAVKRQGAYGDVAYVHRGPAHLSMGQEGAAVGQAAALTVDDHIFGSHRSHGEVLAKGLAAIRELPEDRLGSIMAEFRDGIVLAAMADSVDGLPMREQATGFLLYGFLAEVFARSTGFNSGMSGSMHAFFTPFGIFPNNAIVGASAPIAVGAALFKRTQGSSGMVVANIGDGSSGCGPVWESMNFASMGQLNQLFEEEKRGGLPVLFFFVNNFYGMGGQTIGETMGYEQLSRIGAGINPHNMHAETIDGNDPLAVWEAVLRAKARIEAGEGPVLLDCQTYRYSGHSTSDPVTYRTQAEIDMWKAIDPIPSFAAELISAGMIDGPCIEVLAESARKLIHTALVLASDPERSPLLTLDDDPDVLGRMVFSNESIDLADAPPAVTLIPPETSTRLAQLALKSRRGLIDGKKLSGAKAITFRESLFESIFEHATNDGRLVIYGEDNRDWDGAFGVYRGLTEVLPYHRLFNAPISEAAIVGSSVGYAMEGGRALVELMYADFIGRAGDEIFNQLAKWQAMSGGLLDIPVVLRVSVGARYGAQHSQDWTALPAHVPGLKVVYPATPYDAKGLMAQALASNDPVVFFESQRNYDDVETLQSDGVPTEYFRIPFGQPKVVVSGDDLTILSIGPTLGRCLEVADRLRGSNDLGVEVIDARSLVPFDPTLVLDSVRRTGRLMLVTDACTRGSFATTLAQKIQVLAFDDLDAPVVVAGSKNWVSPPLELEDEYFPSVESLTVQIDELMVPLGRRAAGDLSIQMQTLARRMAVGL
jgi:2-oxoisovalerate dehydrogenase E1 component